MTRYRQFNVVVALGFALSVTAATTLQAQTDATRAIPVTPVPTTWGLVEQRRATYPETISVNAPRSLEIAAYGAGNTIWLGPASWTGQAALGANGNAKVTLHPRGTGGDLRIDYRVVRACLVCQLDDAAPYFPAARKDLKEKFAWLEGNSDAATMGVTTTQVTPTRVRYSLPDVGNVHVRGLAIYEPANDGYFAQVQTTLPRDDDAVSDFLLAYFADHLPR